MKGKDDVKKEAVPMISCERVLNQSDRDIEGLDSEITILQVATLLRFWIVTKPDIGS